MIAEVVAGTGNRYWDRSRTKTRTAGLIQAQVLMLVVGRAVPVLVPAPAPAPGRDRGRCGAHLLHGLLYTHGGEGRGTYAAYTRR